MKAKIIFKGGPGSGHHGHAGRKGQRGGSLPGSGGASGSAWLNDERVDTSDLPLSMGADWRDLNNPRAREFFIERAENTGQNIDAQIGRAQLDKMHVLANDSAYELPEDKIVYFGLRGDSFADMSVGDEFSALGTRSTAENQKRASTYAGDVGGVFEVSLQKGDVAIPSTVFDINETVLLPGSKFRISSIKSDGTYVVDMISDGKDYINELVQFRDKIDTIAAMNSKEVFKGGPGSGHHGHRGMPGHRGGSLPGPGSANYLPQEERVWQGTQHEGKRQMTNVQTGEIGEALASRALEDIYGVEFSTLNVGVNNAPIDLGGDHTAVEVKAGPATNVRTAHHWRATVSTAGKAERELIRQMTKEEKRAHNIWKGEQVLERKNNMLNELSSIAGAPVKPVTVGVVLTADGSRGDVFLIPGFHLYLPWKDYAAEDYYIGTYEYGG